MRISSLLKAPRRARRVANIGQKLVAHGFGFLASQLGILKMLPPWARVLGAGAIPPPDEMPRKFARLLEELGPTFVKFGQMLSTRPDLLPHEYVEALRRICYSVAPFPTDAARAIIASELNRPVDETFSEFSAEPLASGSIAQVYTARLQDGTPVVVKVRRPGIERIIDDDLAIMQYLAEQADRLEEFRHLRVPMLVSEFAHGIRRELNFLTEAAYTHRFHTAFKEKGNVAAPRVYWDCTTACVLTMRRLTGMYLNELDKRPGSGELKRRVARTILDCFLGQFFEMGTFHADPHLGNILASEHGEVSLVDFGLVGRIGESLRSQLGAFVIALGSGQLDFAAEVLAEIGSVRADAAGDDFREEVAALLERNFCMPIERMDLQRSFLEVMQIVRKYEVVMPRDFVLLGKALVTVGSMVMQLDPTLNVAKLAEPYARTLAREKMTPSALGRALTVSAHHVGMLLRNAPRDLRLLLGRLRTGSFNLSIQHTGFDRYLRELDRTGNRLALSIILAAIVMSSTTMMANKVGPLVHAFGTEASVLGLIGYTLGFVLGALLIVAIFRSGKL